MEEVTGYNAIVTRSEPGWSIYVPEVDRHTYAAHLREIEPMARDLVQVMTDIPIEDIRVAIQLPDDLSAAITTMRTTREEAEDAEKTARTAQQAAATVLRNAGAPLRDIAALLGVSHQRVHQVLEEADAARRARLERFHEQVDRSLAAGKFELPATGNTGGSAPVVVAFADELVPTLTKRIQRAGGYANVFVRDGDGRVRFVAVIGDQCAIGNPDDTMTGSDAPGATASIGILLDYVQQCPNGVTISADPGHPAYARDAQSVELADV